MRFTRTVVNFAESGSDSVAGTGIVVQSTWRKTCGCTTGCCRQLSRWFLVARSVRIPRSRWLTRLQEAARSGGERCPCAACCSLARSICSMITAVVLAIAPARRARFVDQHELAAQAWPGHPGQTPPRRRCSTRSNHVLTSSLPLTAPKRLAFGTDAHISAFRVVDPRLSSHLRCEVT